MHNTWEEKDKGKKNKKKQKTNKETGPTQQLDKGNKKRWCVEMPEGRIGADFLLLTNIMYC